MLIWSYCTHVWLRLNRSVLDMEGVSFHSACHVSTLVQNRQTNRGPFAFLKLKYSKYLGRVVVRWVQQIVHQLEGQ